MTIEQELRRYFDECDINATHDIDKMADKVHALGVASIDDIEHDLFQTLLMQSEI
jgi:hypothetical protein